eukprot:CAMPEP_0183339716 /NCGR_PEP_ID=MMETSP0164_2-20130417/6543_1 /TAXON_ID=221442 /ORGANISM="Coccolithus pelagicus ssp braarudi, Strain PLY182g" /LENGTH=233 /DNA_ID=CAMNT_0025509765 /DNA_START=29 /DNA_END=730 /DNA_ORIENTATION=+
MEAKYSAVVAGATGATGREMIRMLLGSSRCTSVTALVRSAAKAAHKFEKTAAGTPIENKSKLNIVEFDWEALVSEGSNGAMAQKLAGHSLGVNCIGTTKKDAGGMKGWMRVDRDYYNAFTHGCKTQDVPALLQVSWSGASPKSFLAQPRTKGECDAVAMAAGFAYLAVLRPGLLDRGEERRFFPEGIAMKLGVPAIKVADVAQAGVVAFEAPRKPTAEVLGNQEMRQRLHHAK